MIQSYPIFPLPQHIHSLLHYQHLPPEWYICHNWLTYIDPSSSPRVHSLHLSSLLAVCIVWMWTNVWHVCHHYTIMLGIFTVLKILCVLPLHSSPYPLNPGNHWSFYFLLFGLFQNVVLLGSYGRVTFSEWLLSLSNVYLRFVHVFSQLYGTFLLSAQ